MLRRMRGSTRASTISVMKLMATIVPVRKKIIAPASCWSFERASASINNDPASVSVRINATIGSSLKMRFRSNPNELIIGLRACRAG